MARFILETDDPSGRIILLIDYPSYKHISKCRDELRKQVRLKSEQTNYADSSS